MDSQALTGLRRTPGVAAAYIVDGAGVAETSASGMLAEAQGALLAALIAALKQAASDLEIGDLGEVILEAGAGALLATSLAGGRAAVVLADAKANLGLIRVELRRLRRSL